MSVNKVLGASGIHHVALRARDFDKAVKFYTETIGLTTAAAWGAAPKRAILLDTGDGSCLEIFEKPDLKPASDDAVIVHVALRTSDTDAAIERVRAAGCRISVEPLNADLAAKPKPLSVRIGFCIGPDNVQIEFFQTRE